MSVDWSNQEPRRKPLAEQPWLWFGIALVIAVGAVMFAVVNWVFQDYSADRLKAVASEAREQADDAAIRIVQLEGELGVCSTELEAEREQRAEFEARSRKAEAAQESLQRELDATKHDLKKLVEHDALPAKLPMAELKRVLTDIRSVRTRIIVSEQDTRLLSRSGLELHLQRQVNDIGVLIDDSADSLLMMEYVVAEITGDFIAVTATLYLLQPWKVPGAEAQRPVTVWHDHQLAVSSRERATIIAEMLMERLVERLGDDFSN